MNHDNDIFRQAVLVSQHLLNSSRQLVTAESCTGGWIGKALTDIPGSSRWYRGGVIAYSNELKQQLLGVNEETLATHGAVSDAVVREMATGALERLGGDIAVAVSGIAGPDGAQPGKPVGTVWIAFAWRHGQAVHVNARLKLFSGDREEVRRRSVMAALQGVAEL
ncbi:MAG TPA: CinA family protein [Steroidobacteraceae bacterium]|nr:CinA family protein [Steroidobacteraceae bacterium]